jgi:hypothetical protein
VDAAGKPVTEIVGASEPGLQRVQWDMCRGKDDGEEPQLVPAGKYQIRLQIGETSIVRKVRIFEKE